MAKNKNRDPQTGRFTHKHTKEEVVAKLDAFIQSYLSDDDMVYYGLELLKQHDLTDSTLSHWRCNVGDEDIINRLDLIIEIQKHKVNSLLLDKGNRNVTGTIAFSKFKLGYVEEEKRQKLELEAKDIADDNIIEIGFEHVES